MPMATRPPSGVQENHFALHTGRGVALVCRPMHLRVIVAGKPALPYAKLGIEEYQKRLRGTVEIVQVKAGTSKDVSARLLEKSAGCFRIALDERGLRLTTSELAARFESLERRGEVKTAAFLIGAADGHTPELRESCDLLLSLSSFTLQHELALVVLLEQLYRIASLRSGSPYHRE